MDAHLANTRAVAEFLPAHPAVTWVCWPGTPDHPDHARAQRYLPGGPGAVLSFGVVGGRDAGGGSSRPSSCAATSPTSVTSAPSSSTRRRRRTSSSTTTPSSRPVSAGPRPHLGRAGGPGRHLWDLDQALTAAAKHDERDDRGPAGPGAARDPAAARARSPSSGCRPTRAERATSSRPTCCRRAARSRRSGSSTPRAARSSDDPSTRHWTNCPGRPISSTCSAADDLPAVAKEVVALGRQTLWFQLGLHTDEAAAIATAAGIDGRAEPLSQDRARPLPRWTAPGRVRHRRRVVPPFRPLGRVRPRHLQHRR